MLKKTTFKLSLSLFGSSVLSAVLSLLIIMMLGSIGAKSSSSFSNSSAKSHLSSTQTVSNTSGIRSNTGASGTTSVANGSSASGALASSGTVKTSSSDSSAASKKKATSTYNLLSTGGLISYPAGKIFVGILCMLIFAALIYTSAWHEGNRDPNRIKYGHIKKFMPKGLVSGLLAIIPYAILTTLFLATGANTAKAAPGAIINIIYRILNIQYIVFSDAYISVPIACYMLLLVLPVISGLGYLAGYHNFMIITRILYKNQKRPNGTYRKSISNLKK